MARWEMLRDRDAESRVYLSLLGRKRNVYVIFKDFGGKFNDKEITGLYTRAYLEAVVKKLARAKVLKTSVGQSPNGKRPVLLYESDIGVYAEFLREHVGMTPETINKVKKLIEGISPLLIDISTIEPSRIKKFDALFLITAHVRCATEAAWAIEELAADEVTSQLGDTAPLYATISNMKIKSKRLIDILKPITLQMIKMFKKSIEENSVGGGLFSGDFSGGSLIDRALDVRSDFLEVESAFLTTILDTKKIPNFEAKEERKKEGGEK